MILSILLIVGTDTEHFSQISDLEHLSLSTMRMIADAMLFGVLLMSSTQSSSVAHTLLHCNRSSLDALKGPRSRGIISIGFVT